MENLRETLSLPGACIEEWTHRKTKKDGLKVNFTVSAPLPRMLADQLKCGGIYESDTGRIDLLHKLKDVVLVVATPGIADASSSIFPDLLYCFKAKRDEQQFTVEFSAHISVRAEEMHEFLKASPEVIDIEIRPRSVQENMFDGGTRVDLAKSERDTGCVACNNDIPMGDLPRMHASGAACTATEPAAEPALASAVATGGKTPGRAPRKDRSTVN